MISALISFCLILLLLSGTARAAPQFDSRNEKSFRENLNIQRSFERSAPANLFRQPSKSVKFDDALGCACKHVNRLAEGVFSSFLPVKNEMTFALFFKGKSVGGGVEYRF